MAGLCRICTVALQPTHCVSLFTPEGKPKDVAERLGSLLNVPVESDDGLPKHACRTCVRQATSIETKYESLRYTAQSSYKRLCGTAGTRKRPKDTSSATGVSPHTARTRPLSKRVNRCNMAKELFPQHSEYTCIKNTHTK